MPAMRVPEIVRNGLSSFYVKVWKAMDRIPHGKVTTYKELARAIGNPHSARAIGNACNKNPNAPHTPCHRVVASDGSLGGYALGLDKKIKLLQNEGIQLLDKKIDLERYGFTFPKR